MSDWLRIFAVTFGILGGITATTAITIWSVEHLAPWQAWGVGLVAFSAFFASFAVLADAL